MKRGRATLLCLFLIGFGGGTVVADDVVLSENVVVPVNDSDLSIEETFREITTDGNHLVVLRLFRLNYRDVSVRMRAYCVVDSSESMTAEELGSRLGIESTRQWSEPLVGIFDAWESLPVEWQRTIQTTSGIDVKKIISHWGSGRSKDILVYQFTSPDPLFSLCSLQIYDVWSSFHRTNATDLNTDFVESYGDQDDPSIHLYAILDEAVRNLLIAETE